MNTHSPHSSRTRPTRLFLSYVAQLVCRSALFAAGVYLLVRDPALLDFREQFGLAHGLSFVDVAYALLLLDLISKFRPHAKIAMGSRKQYGKYHVPTARMFAGGMRELREEARAIIADLLSRRPPNMGEVLTSTLQAVQETAQGVWEAGRQFSYSIDVLRVLPWPEEDLTSDELMRERIRADRMREIVPVIIFWVVGNLAVFLLLDRFGLLNTSTALVWALFYSLFDMICVVLWCPLQLALMRNRCCTTCQIFNWDGIMTVTPLIPYLSWFSTTLVVIALAVLVRWELAFYRHPERFDDRTNASLLCANCQDHLCYLRKPLIPRRARGTS